MTRRLRILLVGSLLAVGFSGLALLASPQAAAVNLFGNACSGAGRDSAACSGSGADTITGTDGIIIKAAELVSIVAGIAAVLVIMLAGIMFMTANGDSGKISTAKSALTYAIVGILIVFLARTIVVFVVNSI
jgi:hypothetical protein